MERIAIFYCVTLAIFIGVTNSPAQDNLRSDIDPFSSPAPPRIEETASSEKSEKGIGSILPKWTFGKKSDPKRPSVLQKMNRNTKQMMRKSKEVLMPWTRKDDANDHVTGLKKKPTKKSSFISNLLKPFPDEPEPIMTADDWFRQARPTR